MSVFKITSNPKCPICKTEIHLNWSPTSSALPPNGFEVIIPARNGKMISYHGQCVNEELQLLKKLKNQMLVEESEDDRLAGVHFHQAWSLIKKIRGNDGQGN